MHLSKAATPAACLDMFQMLEWLEREEVRTSAERLSETFVSVQNVEKPGGELFDLLCTNCSGEALTMVRSVEGMDGWRAWQNIHSQYNPSLARAIMSMVDVTSPPKVAMLKDFEHTVRVWEEKVQVLERDFAETLSS